MGVTLFEELGRERPDYHTWRQAAKRRYLSQIVPLKGQPKFLSLCTAPKPGSGITLAHQPLASDGQASLRPLIIKVWDLDRHLERHPPTLNMLSIRQGIPYGTGISGNVHIFMSFFLEIQGKRNIDSRHAILGLLITLVYDGGHSWNEGLQTVNFLENVLAIGVLSETVEPTRFVADYSRFVSVLKGADTENYLADAIKRANKMAILYRRNHSALRG